MPEGLTASMMVPCMRRRRLCLNCSIFEMFAEARAATGGSVRIPFPVDLWDVVSEANLLKSVIGSLRSALKYVRDAQLEEVDV